MLRFLNKFTNETNTLIFFYFVKFLPFRNILSFYIVKKIFLNISIECFLIFSFEASIYDLDFLKFSFMGVIKVFLCYGIFLNVILNIFQLEIQGAMHPSF